MQSDHTYLDWPAVAGMPNSFNNDIVADFRFGVSSRPVVLPDRATSQGAHFRALRQLANKDEAVALLTERLNRKVAAAVHQGAARSQSMLAHIIDWRCRAGRASDGPEASPLAHPDVQAAIAAALDALQAAIVPPPASAPVDTTIAELRTQFAAMAARLAQLEGVAA